LAIVGVVPAAGHATRLQPLECSKEVLPVGGRPVMDLIVERMRAAGCEEIRVVTRPEKADVVAHAAELVLGLEGLAGDTVVLFGYPDSIWEPVEGFRALARSVASGWEAALGLFRSSGVERPDVVTLDGAGRVRGIDVGSAREPPQLFWGCAAARARALRGVRDHDDPGDHLAELCAHARVAGVFLSESYLDVGTPRGLREALGPGVAA
jgi:glucose-1-phosphate thymidylyltransferase